MVFLNQKFNSMGFYRLAFGLLCFWFCMGGRASGQDLENLAGSKDAGPWIIAADRITYDEPGKVYIAEGNVVITRADRRLTADRVRFDHQQMKASADGHVMLIAGKDVLTGEGVDIDLNSETGTIYGGSIFIQENHFYIQGDTIQKTAKSTYTIDRGSFSSCDGKKPDWKITGRNLNVTVEGYGTVQHAALWVKDVPVFYLPYLFFPVKLKRQSGLLTPEFSHSDRKGFQYVQPFFWAINDSSDATLYADVMETRGVKMGMEYRYILDKKSKGALMLDGFSDRKIDDGVSADSQDWGYAGDAAFRPNSDRYWFRMKQDQTLPFGFTGRMDLDIVSDQDYLHEFKNGYSGFDETDRYFSETFGRDLDDYNDRIRTNRINLLKTGNAYSLNLEGRWYDDVVKRRSDAPDDTLQQLPFAGLALAKQGWEGTPLFWNGEASYTNFYRESGTSGQRMDLHPRMYLPYHYGNYFFFEPSIGLRQTSWLVDQWDEAGAGDNRDLSRTLYDLNLEFSTEISRIYSQDGSDAIRHSIQPKIAYQYLSDFNEDDHPYFDEIDALSEQNRIVYSLISNWISRSAQRPAQSDAKAFRVRRPARSNAEALRDLEEDLKNEERLRYNPFLRIELEQSYDIGESEREEPFSPVYGEVWWNPKEFIALKADATWSVYDDDFQTRNVRMLLRNQRSAQVSVEHRYNRNVSESIWLEGYTELTDSLALFGDFERNLHKDENISYGAGIVYQSQCWALELRFSEEDEDLRFDFRIRLRGLGDI
ncbi:MAG: LPS assembly protein LptD [Desulfobacterales bacterium]|nr:LPS assembly protein LptD [Desulfobacterales bacterium]